MYASLLGLTFAGLNAAKGMSSHAMDFTFCVKKSVLAMVMVICVIGDFRFSVYCKTLVLQLQHLDHLHETHTSVSPHVNSVFNCW